jgi:hypothetical protein
VFSAYATKGVPMAFVIIGVIIGALAALGHIPGLGHVLGALSSAVVNDGLGVTTKISSHIAGHDPRLGLVIGVVLGVALPGMACMVLILAARAASSVRRGVGALILLIGLLGFFILPFAQALLVLILSLVVAALLTWVTGAVVVAPLSAIAAVLAVSYGRILLHGTNTTIAKGIVALGVLSHVNSPILWKVALLVVAWAGFVGAAMLVVRPSSHVSDS